MRSAVLALGMASVWVSSALRAVMLSALTLSSFVGTVSAAGAGASTRPHTTTTRNTSRATGTTAARSKKRSDGDRKPAAKPSAQPPGADHKPAAKPAADPQGVSAFIATFTADAVVGGADRIDGSEAQGVVAFTFDDGPDKTTTPQVLDALKAYNVPATFFVVTQRLAGKHGEVPRQILARELAEGHLIGSHSVSHAHLGKAGAGLLDREVDASLRALHTAAKLSVGLFRPPFGSLSAAGAKRLKARGLTNALWSIDTLDWQAKNPGKLRTKVVNAIVADGGGVVLMHDTKSVTANVIAGILDDLEAVNCKRLAQNQNPIIPVSLHYFLKNGKTTRTLPAAVTARTEAYKNDLPKRCAARPVAPAPSPVPVSAPTARASQEPGLIPVTPPR